MTEPDGYWAIVASESLGASTTGTGTDWSSYTYAQPQPITGLEAQGTVLQATLDHEQRAPLGGMVRAYWYDPQAQRWTVRPELDRRWGELGLAGSAATPPAPTLAPPGPRAAELPSLAPLEGYAAAAVLVGTPILLLGIAALIRAARRRSVGA